MTDAATDTVDNAVTPDTDPPETTWQHEAGLDGDANFEKFESVADLAKSYTEASSMIGNSVRFPSKDAGDEDVSLFNQKMLDRGFYKAPNMDDSDNVRGIQSLLGLPKEAKGYNFDEIAGYEKNDEVEGEFKAMAHEAGLTAQQANTIHGWLGNNIATQSKSAGEDQDASMAELKGEWGQAFEHKMNGAKNAASLIEERVPGITAYFDSMADNGYDSNMVRLMDAVGEMMGESGATASAPRETLTKAEAQSRVREIQNNPDHPANNEDDPHHEEAVKERLNLLHAAYS